MSNIVTVTANTAIDFYIEVDALDGMDVIQAQDCSEFVCGKGVNVARAVAMLGKPVACLGFVGRASLPAYTELDSDLIQTDFTAVNGKTRTNVTLFDMGKRREIHIRTKGFRIASDDIVKLKSRLERRLQRADIVVMSGSLPPGAADHFYYDLIEWCHGKAVKVLLDSSGAALRWGIQAKPFLLKPNLQELEEWVGEPLVDEAAIIAAARALIDIGVEWVYVSRGAAGVIAVGRETTLAVNVDVLSADIVSYVGCGDAMLAGIAVSLAQGKNVEETVRMGVSCAVANLFCRHPGLFERELQQELKARCKIRMV